MNQKNEELDIEVIPELYPWTDNTEEMRRAFIFEYFNWNNDIDANIQIKAMTSIEQWLTK